EGALPRELADVLDRLQYFLWKGPEDDGRLLSELMHALDNPVALRAVPPPAGVLPLDSPYYVVRPTDAEFQAAVARRDSVVLIRGARQVLARVTGPLVWAFDEADRLFPCSFGSEVFGLFRSWHNARVLDPTSSWSRLTLAIAYATEAHLFITDMNQSPFNIGTLLALEDFTPDQVAWLNDRYGAPLRNPAELQQFVQLVGGHPYLVNRGLYRLVQG